MYLVYAHTLTRRYLGPGPPVEKMSDRTGFWWLFLENMDAGVSNAVFHVFDPSFFFLKEGMWLLFRERTLGPYF